MKKLGIGVCMLLLSAPLFADNDSCTGPTSLLALVDRPTVSDSPCTVAPKHALLEIGMQAQKTYPKSGFGYILPQAELRLGLPSHMEAFFLLPNDAHQTVSPYQGVTATEVGLKYRVSSNPIIQTAIEGGVVLPSGSSQWGSQHGGAIVSGVLSYNMTPTLNITAMAGVSRVSQPGSTGGQYVTSVNPDLVATYSLTSNLEVYLEGYGQSKPAPGLGSGFNLDSGVIYLVNSNLTIDAEVGQRLSGQVGGFQHYIGTGLAILF